MRWTSEKIRSELLWITQYGKSEVKGRRGDDGQWRYYWECWCHEGWVNDRWDHALDDLEWHMWTGMHK